MDNNEIKDNDTLNNLLKGNVILCPTDTLWGLSCDIFNKSAVERIYSIKKRNRSKPLILLVSSMEMLKEYVPHIHPRIETLLFYHMRPLTIIFNEPLHLPTWITAKDNTIAIRLVLDSHIKTIIQELGHPIVSTSANVQGEPTPDEYTSISSHIRSEVDYIVPLYYDNKVQRSASVIIRYNENGEIELVR